MKLIAMMSDWTYAEGAVGTCKGVIKSIDPVIDIIDITHEIPNYDIYAASYRLKQVLPFWPKESVCMVVVDPGVGTSRVGVVAKTKQGHLIVTPDNGTLTHIHATLGLSEVRAIRPELRLSSPHQTNVFHGRDIFAYVSALLASQKLSFEDVGPQYAPTLFPLNEPIQNEDSLSGIIEIVDPNFGNAWSNIPVAWLKSWNLTSEDKIEVIIQSNGFERVLSCGFAPTFGHVKPNECVLYHNELDCVAIALNQASFIKTYHISYGPQWSITLRRII